jgi:hypothetical protein
MKTIALRTTEGRFIAHEVRVASSLTARWVGLSGERSLPTRNGLLLSSARGVHTLGMRFAIDVVFLSRQMRVLGLAPGVAPWRVLLAPRGTGRVLELAAGQIAATGLKTGTFILVETARPQQCQRSPIRFSLRLPQRYEDRARTQEASASSSRSLPQ